ncbi:DUF7331 family protein [Halapricum desulfuricans]|uniref:Uncharacterized protein n=1 Tax=Halapricum desulfuricans TaxID=2841257 RepID=A0A897NMP0_9EURY|nr:hypothetical protein [Halapricum desulfuricans]QSG06758.1 Uncharacterized protein HSR121_2437 [Halapricum desulfuricans]QSG12745.1 Uncharacterized protein HSBGL_2340 [Halapricum desulfuricans]
MSNRVNAAGESDRAATSETTTGAETIEAYEEDGTVVFYDAENPIAWIESDSAVSLTDAV